MCCCCSPGDDAARQPSGRSGQGHARSEAIAAARQSGRSGHARQGLVRPPPDAGTRSRHALSAFTPKAASPAPRRCRSTARPGRSCGSRAIATGAIPNWCASSNGSSAKGTKVGWRGLLVGDMSQPRGGPMLTGHASHQVGLDADIWLTPMPDRELTAPSARKCRPPWWSPPIARTSIRRSGRRPRRDHQGRRAGSARRAHLRQCRRSRRRSAARPATTAAGCTRCGRIRGTTITSTCASSARRAAPECKAQDPVPAGDGCGKELDHWFSEAILHPKPSPIPPQPRPPLKMADLPPACRQVLLAP